MITRGDYRDVFRDVFGIQLVIADPPYGGIVSEAWDKGSESSVVSRYVEVARYFAQRTFTGSALYLFGGIGRPGMRAFFKAIPAIEAETPWQMAACIAWQKRRAYGVQHNYLFTREEIAYFVHGDAKKPRVFNVPYLDVKRGYPGYNAKYPAKSEYKRRGMVWNDVTEIMRGKQHKCQKPDRLFEIIISASSNEGDLVADPFAGAGTSETVARSLGRDWVGCDIEAVRT